MILLNHIFYPLGSDNPNYNAILNTNKYMVCQTCNHIVYEVIKGDCPLYVNSSYSYYKTESPGDILNITCEEMQIKKLLE